MVLLIFNVLAVFSPLKSTQEQEKEILGDIKRYGWSKVCSDALQNLENGGERCSDLPEEEEGVNKRNAWMKERNLS